MALGKKLGSFELQATSFSLSKAKGDSIQTQLNFEGMMNGDVEGRILVTMTIVSKDGKDGTFETCGRYFLENGEVIDALTSGKTTSLGGQKWRVAGVGDTSAGQSIATRGEIDLADHAYSGELFERI